MDEIIYKLPSQQESITEDDVRSLIDNRLTAGNNRILQNSASFKNINFGVRYASVVPGENIQDAINILKPTGGIVALGTGTHIVDYDITLASGVYMVGASRSTSIIDFKSNSKSIILTGTSAYSTGTVAVTSGSTSVVGTGTSWATNAGAGQYILLSGIWYPITVVGGNTSITIGIPFAESTISGATYTIATVMYDVKLSDFTVKNSATNAIKIQYALQTVLDNINIMTSATGIRFDDSSQLQVTNVNAVANNAHYDLNNVHYTTWFSIGALDALTGIGLNLNNVDNCKFDSFFILNSATNGVSITNCSSMVFNGLVTVKSGAKGIELVSNNLNIIILSSRIQANTSDGIKLTATSNRCFIEVCTILGNTGYGANVADSTSQENIIVGNTFNTNTAGTINDLGTNTVISGNIPDSVNPSVGRASFTTGENITLNDAVYYANDTNSFSLLLASASLQYASITNNLGIDGGNVTMSAWLYPTSLPALNQTMCIASTSSATSKVTYVLELWNNGGTQNVRVRRRKNFSADQDATWTTTLALSTWVHLVLWYDGTNLKLYSASSGGTHTERATIAATGSGATSGSSHFAIGVEDKSEGNTFTPTTNSCLDGRVDNVRVFNAAIAAATIDGYFGSTPATTETSIVAAYKLENDYTSLVGGFTLTATGSPTFSSTVPFAGTGTGLFRTKANTTGSYEGFLGFAYETKTTGLACKITVAGVVTTFSGLSPGTRYYLSDTAGAISTTVGSNTRKVGIAVSATQLLITNIW